MTTPDTTTYTPETPVTIDVLANDTTGDTVDPTTVDIVGGTDTDGNGTLDELTVPGEGVWTVDPETGALTFTPEDGFTGDPTPVSYTVEDAEGNKSEPGTLTVAADVTSYVPGQPVSGSVLLNDTSGDLIEPTSVVFLATGLKDTDSLSDDGKTVVVAGEGSWTVDIDGMVTFTPVDGFKGDSAPVMYVGQDKEGNTSNAATIRVDALPVVTDDADVYAPGAPVTLSILENDLEGDAIDPATVSLKGGTDTDGNGTLDTLVVAGEGVWTVNALGDLTFTPEAGFTQSPTPVIYTVKDHEGTVSDEAGVSLTVLPVVKDDETTYVPGKPATVNILENDASGAVLKPETIRFTLTGTPAGSLSGGGRALSVQGEGQWSIDPVTGSATFTPEEGFSGSPTPVTYVGEDETGNVSNEGRIRVISDLQPVAVDDVAAYTPGKASVPFDVLGNDNGADAVDPTTVSLIGGVDTDGNGSLDTLVIAPEGTWTVDPVTGSIQFTPLASFPSVPTPVRYSVRDVQGNEVSALLTLVMPALRGAQIPTLNEWMLILLSFLMVVIIFRRRRDLLG